VVVGLCSVVVGLFCEADVLDVTVVVVVSATGAVSVDVELLVSLPEALQAEVMTRKPMNIESRGKAPKVS